MTSRQPRTPIQRLRSSYDPDLPDDAPVTVSNGDLRALAALAANWDGFNHPGSEVGPPGSL